MEHKDFNRQSSILQAIDDVHRSLLFNNLKYGKKHFLSAINIFLKHALFLEQNKNLNVLPLADDKTSISVIDNKLIVIDNPISTTRKGNQKQIKITIKAKTMSQTQKLRDHKVFPRSITPDNTMSASCTSSASDSQEYRDKTSISSYHEESIEASSDSNTEPKFPKNKQDNGPMLEIVQEITDTKTVTSTIRVNRAKIENWNSQCATKLSCTKQTKTKHNERRRKCKQKVINENYCNEMLDQTIYKCDDQCNCNTYNNNNNKNNECDLQNTSIDSIQFGKLGGLCSRKQNLSGGKLLSKRMQRHSTGNQVNTPKNYVNSFLTQNIQNKKTPPIKPPRTFATASSDTSSYAATISKPSTSLDCGHLSSTTLAIGDLQTNLEKPNAARKLGWQMSDNANLNKGDVIPFTHRAKPTCPTIEDINDVNKKIKIGWVPENNKNDNTIGIPQHIANMLTYDDHHGKHNIISSNSIPQPQCAYSSTYKESIDTVDSPRRSRNLERFSTDTVYSTPQNYTPNILQLDKKNVLHASTQHSDVYCKNCQEKCASASKCSFGKSAIKRTKTFLEASKNILNRSTINKQINTGTNEPIDMDDQFSTPTKSETTAQFNKETLNMTIKPSCKSLGLTPPPPEQNSKQHDNDIVVENPKRIYERFLSSVKRTPPKKPERKSLLKNEKILSNTTETNKLFDFQRTVSSPPTVRQKNCFSSNLKRGFSLSPKRLFKYQRRHSVCASINSISDIRPTESYKSFMEADDGFVIFMGEYLRKMCLKIEEDHTPPKVELMKSRLRKISASTVSIEYEVPRQIKIDCHEEPVYAEIGARASKPMSTDIPIYATVNKNKKIRRSKSLDSIHQSHESLNDFLVSTEQIDLVQSIQNFLDQKPYWLPKQTEAENYNTVEISTDTVDKSSVIIATDTSIVMPEYENEQLLGCFAPSHCEQHVNTAIIHYDSPNENDENDISNDCLTDCSSSIVLTESICDEVQRGECINNEITTVINRLEQTSWPFNLNQIQAMPESDDGSIASAQQPVILTKELPSETFPKKSPTYTHFIKDTVRNSLRKSSKYFKSGKKQLTSKKEPNNSKLSSAPSMIELSDDYMSKLTNQIQHQRSIREQLQNAIDVCRSNQGFQCSLELVEAERLLLVSQMKEKSAKNELIRIDYDDEGLIENYNQIGKGKISIKRLICPLKREEIYDAYFKYFYVCICWYRDQVLSTYAQQRNTADDQKDKVIFDNLNIQITDLNPNFQIKVEIYMLRLRILATTTVGKNKKRSPILNPAKMFTMTSGKNGLDNSRFRLQGTAWITSAILGSTSSNFKNLQMFSPRQSQNSPTQSHNICYSSTNEIMLKVTPCNPQCMTSGAPILLIYSSDVQLDILDINGFLNIGNVNNGSVQWHRRWCWIKGCSLHLSSPSQTDEKPMVRFIKSKI